MTSQLTLIPTVIDEGTRGDRMFDLYSLLLRERIVFLGQEIDDQIANVDHHPALYLEAQDPEKDISPLRQLARRHGVRRAWPSTT